MIIPDKYINLRDIEIDICTKELLIKSLEAEVQREPPIESIIRERAEQIIDCREDIQDLQALRDAFRLLSGASRSFALPRGGRISDD